VSAQFYVSRTNWQRESGPRSAFAQVKDITRAEIVDQLACVAARDGRPARTVPCHGVV
jgi:hypothetical protein